MTETATARAGRHCWLQCAIGGKLLKERIVLELFTDVTPKTCANFLQLCNDGKTLPDGTPVPCVEGTSTPMTYRNSTFHRIIAGFMIQGGDYTNHNGTGGFSIYGEKFEDENFEVPCDKAGLLAMANAGPNTNGSQFFITTAPAPHLTGKHVVFGKVVHGMNSVRALERTSTGANDKPSSSCVIVDCGVFAEGAVLRPPPADGSVSDGDNFSDYPEDNEPALSDSQLIDAGEQLRQVGNKYFKEGAFEESIEKYSKATRYLQAATKTTVVEKRINESLVACFNNSAMCSLKLGKWVDARQSATQAIELDKNNSKALFRRGTAYMNSNDEESAIRDFQAAQAIEPENTEISAKLKEAKEKQKARNAKIAAGFKKMFS